MKNILLLKKAKIKGDIYFSFINKNWKCLYLFSVFFLHKFRKNGGLFRTTWSRTHFWSNQFVTI